MKKIIIFSIILIINGIYCTAQNDVHPNIPEVSTLIRQVEEPVSYNRGRVNISIPLYTIEENGISIPITLTYNHGGLKANERSKWVGLGWSLNAEPSICTTGRSADYTSASNTNIDRNYIYYMTDLAKGIHNEEPSAFYYSLPNKSGSFYFNWTESNGFYPVTVPFDPIKINRLTNYGTITDVFEITDDNGILYRFGKSLINNKYVVGDNGNGLTTLYKGTEIVSASKKDTIFFEYYDVSRETVVSLDHLYQVEDAIEPEPYGYRNYLIGGHISKESIPNYPLVASNQYYVPNIIYEQAGKLRTDYFYCYASGDTHIGCIKNNGLHAEATRYTTDVSGNDFKSIGCPKIKSIKFKNGKIVFNSNNPINGENPTLESISIYNSQDKLIRKIKLNNRIVSSTTGFPLTQPLLQSLDILDENEQPVETYKFGYNGDPFTNYTTCVNFWGYISGNDNDKAPIQTSTIPVRADHMGETMNFPFLVGQMDMEVSASQAGILTSIANSLGGTTSYEYESDSYAKKDNINDPLATNLTYFSTLKMAGGLRIKKIKYIDPLAKTILTREFKYGKKWKDEMLDAQFPYPYNYNPNEESGLGFLKRGEITLNDYMHTQTKNLIETYPNQGNPFVYKPTRLRTFSTWLFGDITYSGSPVLYDRVSEYITKTTIDENTGNELVMDNGKIVYDYQDFRDYRGTLQNGLYEDSKNDWKCGQLLSKKIYVRTDNIEDPYSLISRTDYEYKTFNKENIAVGKALLSTFPVCEGGGSQPLNLANFESANYYKYDIETGILKINSQTDSVFTPQGVVVTNKTFNYDNPDHLYPTSIITTNSDGKIHTQNLAYTLDAGTLTDPDHIKAKSDLKTNWIISPVLEDKETNQSSSKTTYNSYKTFDNGLPLLNRKLFEFNNNGKYEHTSFLKYDYAGKPLSILKDNAEQSVYLWGYEDQYLIAEIKNATYSDVEAKLGGATQIRSLSDALIPDMTTVDALRSALPNALVTTYTYKPLVGMTSMTDPRGVITRYVYDTANRLALVRDNNANILKQYKYSYQNTPAVGLPVVSYPAMSATIQKNGVSSMGVKDCASVSISGGSGSYTCIWCLKNILGTVLATSTTSTNNSSSNFYYTCPETGDNITIQCVIIDNVTGKSITTTKVISCMSLTATIITNTPYLLGSTGTATLAIMYGSGNYSYKWTTVLTGNTSATTSSYSFICSKTGSWVLQCIVTDLITSKTIIVRTSITIN